MALSVELQAMPIDVHILAGQSNANKRHGNAQLPTEYKQQDWLYRSWTRNANGIGDPALDFSTYQSVGFGPEPMLGATLAAAPNDIALVHFSYGGTSLAEDWHPQATTGLQLYQEFVVYVNESMSLLTTAGYQPTLRSVYWVQGEDDALDQSWAASYQANLDLLIDSARLDFATPDMQFVATLLHEDGQRTYTSVVREQQILSKATLISIDDLDLQPDLVHHEPETALGNGERLAKAYLQIPPGDFDYDRGVTGLDFLNWQAGDSPTSAGSVDLLSWESNYGTNVPNGTPPGDLNYSGTVNGLDFLGWQSGQTNDAWDRIDLIEWRANYGKQAALASSLASIPEPSSSLIFFTSCLTLLASRIW